MPTKHSQYCIDYMKRRLAAGLCQQCGKPREGASKRFCPQHLERHRYLGRRRTRLRAGLDPEAPVGLNRRTPEQKAETTRKQREARQQKVREKVRAGLCGSPGCREPHDPGSRHYCTRHLLQNRERNTKRVRQEIAERNARLLAAGLEPPRRGRRPLSPEERAARQKLRADQARQRYRDQQAALGKPVRPYRTKTQSEPEYHI